MNIPIQQGTIRAKTTRFACDPLVPSWPELIQQMTAEEFRIHPGSINQRRREDWIVLPRQIAMLLCRELTPLSVALIGEAFERDHGTVSHGTRAAQERIETDKKLAERVARLREKVRQRL